MSEFDPYLKWLGIREQNRPINHYRLLGLDLFESDAEVISMAADRQMSHIRTYQNGPKGDLSQQILNELSRARRCLLTADKKADYDATLSALKRRPPPLATPVPNDGLSPPPKSGTSVEPGLPSMNPAEHGREGDDLVSVTPTVTPGISIGGHTESQHEFGVRADRNSRKKNKQREKKQLVWGIVGWLFGGIAAVGVAAAVIGSGGLERFQGQRNVLSESDQGALSANQFDERIDQSVVGSTRPQEKTSASSRIKAKTEPSNQRSGLVSTPAQTGGSSNSSLGNLAKEKPGSAYAQADPSLKNTTGFLDYPAANPADFELFGQVQLGLRAKKTARLESFPNPGAEAFEVYSVRSGVLIGFQAETDAQGIVTWIEPVFHDGSEAFSGTAVGVGSDGDSKFEHHISLAKPGYAVGGLAVPADNPSNFRLKFMNIKGGRLDPTDFYFGDWVGQSLGPIRLLGNAQGFPVVGLFGGLNADRSVATVSLVVLDPNIDPAAKLAESSKLIVPADDEKGISSESEPTGPAGRSELANESRENKFDLPSVSDLLDAKKRMPRAINGIIASPTDGRSAVVVADRLIDISRSQTDLGLKYYLLQEAEKYGIAAGNALTAVNAIREMDESFKIDYWKRVLKAIDRAGGNTTVVSSRDFKQAIDDLIIEARNDEQYSHAGRLISSAVRLAKRAKEPELVEEYEQLERKVQELGRLHKDNVAAMVVLAGDKQDPKANLARARYLFLNHNQLLEAAEHWAKSGQAPWVAIGHEELRFGELDTVARLKLADRWVAVVKRNQTEFDNQCLEHACEIYVIAARNLKGLEREAVDSKRRQVETRFVDSPSR